ncbi:M1 family metallopeptidase [Flammeovirgaceae bacterium SG7u.111]|nr:M1 family metallopeptidase [Flammeovirgaceae bacterium SG7u.132]WPO38479.1 M1 family metallopeptidase [Flammeovirgaceae bacterium SG7u.111]
MKKTGLIFALGCMLLGLQSLSAQERKHTDKFEQLGPKLRSPNEYRTASGAPGVKYWQNTADYVIDIELNDETQSIKGKETITYHNSSPDVLDYLWVQLDQNVRAKDSHSYSTSTGSVRHGARARSIKRALEPEFDGGFKIKSVTDTEGNDLDYIINKTMMSIDMPEKLATSEDFSFSIEWEYNINDRMKDGGRSGYEYFEKDENYLYTIAQFYPRMCVYNDVEGWQNKQFLGSGEFTLPFGKFKVSLTLPSDHVVAATGKLQNPEEVLSSKQIERLKEAETSETPVIIITQKEAEKAEKKKAKDTKTWVFEADSVRDFAFASSRKFIWDAQGVDVGGKTVMAMSYYPKEGNPLWEEYSTRAVAQTLKTYSSYTFDYPYHKAISVHAKSIGMEYPMICFNFGRPSEDGTYPDYVKYGMIMVVIHEVGHNFFPMIVNSDERQWTWMDEGLNSFIQYLTEVEWAANNPKEKDYPFRGGPPKNIVPYMKMDKDRLSPIMTNSEQVQNLGPNAYSKPATALNILRETVMGRELFDKAFKEYSRRWAFKHPTPDDFFRTMEDASGVDLDWFWKGWFYTVDHVDIAMTGVKKLKISTDTTAKETALKPSITADEDFQEFYADLSDEDIKKIGSDMKFYEVSLENKGGLVMPVILEFTYKDGSTEIIRIPAEIWRKNAEQVTKVFTSTKEVERIVLDPFLETADTDLENNYWPSSEMPSQMELFKEKKTAPKGSK